MIWGLSLYLITLLMTDELVDEILAPGDKKEIAYPEKLRLKLLRELRRIRNRYVTSNEYLILLKNIE